MEKALKNTIIADSKEYQLSLKSFFKDEYQYASNCYLIPFVHILYTRRQIFSYIDSSCGDVVCRKLIKCHRHQFLDFINLLYRFNRRCILKKKIFLSIFFLTTLN